MTARESSTERSAWKSTMATRRLNTDHKYDQNEVSLTPITSQTISLRTPSIKKEQLSHKNARSSKPLYGQTQKTAKGFNRSMKKRGPTFRPNTTTLNLDYDPKYDLIKPKTSNNYRFSGRAPRFPMPKLGATNLGSLIDKSHRVSAFYKSKINAPMFGKMMGRTDRSIESRMPHLKIVRIACLHLVKFQEEERNFEGYCILEEE